MDEQSKIQGGGSATSESDDNTYSRFALRHSKGLKAKANRDKMEAALANEKIAQDATETDIQLAQVMMAISTKQMAECGIVEDAKHSSVKYCEDHHLFEDGGEKFNQQMAAAVKDIEEEREWTAKLKKAEMQGDDEGRLRLLQSQLRRIDTEFDDIRAKEGLPPVERDDPFLGSLVDEELFQPPPPRPDCDICMLPLPGRDRCTFQPCCGKTLCDGCIHAQFESSLQYNCPFCREPMPSKVNADETRIKMLKKRIEANDAEAIYMLGAHIQQGSMGLEKDTEKAFELWHRAADLGLNSAHHSLGIIAYEGKDKKKSIHHLRLAAIGGMLETRYHLGSLAYYAGKQHMELAMKHWIIAAEAGHDEALDAVKEGYKKGYATKEVFAKALRAHQSATAEMKSDQRDRAAQYRAINPGICR